MIIRFVIFQKSPVLSFPTHVFWGGLLLNFQNPEKVIITGTYVRIRKEMVEASLKAGANLGLGRLGSCLGR